MGSFTKYVADKGYIVDGIDISENLIQIAKQKVKNVSFSVMDMLDLHLEKTYDGMMLINSIIHIEKKRYVKIISKYLSNFKSKWSCFGNFVRRKWGTICNGAT